MSILTDLKMEYRNGGILQQLIFWNVGLFLIPLVVLSILSMTGVYLSFLEWTNPVTDDALSISSNAADLLWKPWSLITYAFFHANFMHLLFNMLTLFFTGRLFLTFFTQKQFFGLYILAAIFAGVVFVISYTFIPALANGGMSKMVGASGAIMAILVATAAYAPYMEVRMLLIGTVKLWHIAVVLVALDLIYASSENTGGHIAHLSGALFGYLYIMMLKGGTDLSRSVSVITEGVGNLFKTKKQAPFKKVYRNNAPQQRRTEPKTVDMTQRRIDEILDKISKSGYDSLTKDEKDFLTKVGK